MNSIKYFALIHLLKTLKNLQFYKQSKQSGEDKQLQMSCRITQKAVQTVAFLRKDSTFDLTHHLPLLESCIASKSLTQGKIIYQNLLKHPDFHYTNCTTVQLLLNKLTKLFISCSKPELATRVFNLIPESVKQDKVILWNQLIRAYAWHGPFNKAIDLYNDMVDLGVKPTNYTYPFVLKACAALEDIENGERIHQDLKRLGFGSDVYVCTALIDFYVKCWCLSEAVEVFDGMPVKDVVAWNAMILGYSMNGMYQDVIGLVLEMQNTGVSPNSSTVITILPIVGEVNDLTIGKAVHGFCLRRGFESDVTVGTGLLDMYGKCQLLVYAWKIFGGMNCKNEVTWSAMIGACITCDSTQEGLRLFEKMRAQGCITPSTAILVTVIRGCAKLTDFSFGSQMHGNVLKLGYDVDLMVSNTLLSVYAKCGRIDEARQFFEDMKFADSVSYSALISGCVQNGFTKEALQIFRRMHLSDVEPELATVMGLLPACSHMAALRHGRCVHGYSIMRGFTFDISICNALIDMYCKCGKVDIARMVFDKMHKRDVVSWNAMITGYGIHGLGKEALLLFQNMRDIGQMPDEVTFIGLLMACSHSGLVEEGKYWFMTMSKDYSILPRMDHYMCFVDLLGRGGLVDEAYTFIQQMPLEPDVCIWNALLSACKMYKKVELVEEISNKIQNLGPESTGNFVLLSNLYSSVNRWDDAAFVRTAQKDLGFEKSPGSSWVEINGAIHAFVGGDRSHPQSDRIYEKLLYLLAEIKKWGYSAESDFVYQDVGEEEKENILLYHSEKLAVAYALLNSTDNRPILVTKNLRVCGDCHSVLKYITIVAQRDITLRDTVRFHHFKDGVCSCGDFW